MPNEKFACALNDQGRFAQTVVGDFTFVPEAGRHVWKGKLATSMAELAEQVNGAIKSIIDFGDPFKTIEVVTVGEVHPAAEKVNEPAIILEANRQLQGVIEQLAPKKLKPKVPEFA